LTPSALLSDLLDHFLRSAHIQEFMTDSLSVSRRSENMRRVKAKNTKPEMFVRKLLYALGYRYRLHAKDLPGKPDIVFRGQKKSYSRTWVFLASTQHMPRGSTPRDKAGVLGPKAGT
jgi:DNA mismatch endonuclease, patch repair protein